MGVNNPHLSDREVWQNAEQESEPMLRWFTYDHLSEPMRSVSKGYAWLADPLVEHTPRSAERTAALRKLLESKDAAVRAALPTL